MSHGFVDKRVICSHCNLKTVPNQGRCTNLGCHKRLDAPVEVYSRPRQAYERYPIRKSQ